MAFHLAANYQLGADVAGLFGIIGAVGVLFALLAGRTADRRGPHFVIGIACVTILLSWVMFEAWGMIIGLVVAVIFLDFGTQGAQVSNQHVIQSLRPEARNRLNAILMSGMFLGGSVGSAGASFPWAHIGWNAVCALGALLALAGLGVHIMGRRHAKALNAQHWSCSYQSDSFKPSESQI